MTRDTCYFYLNNKITIWRTNECMKLMKTLVVKYVEYFRMTITTVLISSKNVGVIFAIFSVSPLFKDLITQHIDWVVIGDVNQLIVGVMLTLQNICNNNNNGNICLMFVLFACYFILYSSPVDIPHDVTCCIHVPDVS